MSSSGKVLLLHVDPRDEPRDEAGVGNSAGAGTAQHRFQERPHGESHDEAHNVAAGSARVHIVQHHNVSICCIPHAHFMASARFSRIRYKSDCCGNVPAGGMRLFWAQQGFQQRLIHITCQTVCQTV